MANDLKREGISEASATNERLTPRRGVEIREVGPRDGLQVEKPLSVEERLSLIKALVEAGATEIEAASFVSPKAVPAMAGAGELFKALDDSDEVRYWALVPNLRGAEMALESSAKALTVTISASPAYNLHNVAMSIEDSIRELTRITALAANSSNSREIPVDAVVSCAFGSPYEGDISPLDVAVLTERLLEIGVSRVTWADTTGMATPRLITALLESSSPPDVGLHLHDTRGTALLNAYVALEHGVRRFDTAIGGLGGSPFAKGASGNLATCDLVYLLDEMGIASGFNLSKLLEAASLLEQLVGHPLPSKVYAAGLRIATNT